MALRMPDASTSSSDDGTQSPMVTRIETHGEYDRNRRESHSRRAELPEPATEDDSGASEGTLCGLSRKKFWITLIVSLVVLAVVALIVGLVVGLQQRKSSHPNASTTSSPTGFFNGSGVVALDNGDGSSKIIMYTQFHNGEIRRSEYLDGKWTGGQHTDAVVTVGPKARNGSPLMAVSFEQGDELIWRVFYIDVNDYLQESINSNKTQGGWFTGPLGQGRFKASNSPNVGLSACHNSQWYGAPYNISAGGLRLYYGSSNHTVQELRWTDGRLAWDMGASFPNSDGDGGVECTVAHSAPPSITNLWILNKAGELEQRWFDFNEAATTTGHKAAVWNKALSVSGPRPHSHITAITASNDTRLVHFQQANNTVRQLVVAGNAENTTVKRYFDIDEKAALPGSHLGSVVLNTTLGGQEIRVYYQTNGSDISEFIRTLDGDSWGDNLVPSANSKVRRIA